MLHMNALNKLRTFVHQTTQTQESSFDHGVRYAWSELRKGRPAEELAAEADCNPSPSDFDRGVLHALREWYPNFVPLDVSAYVGERAPTCAQHNSQRPSEGVTTNSCAAGDLAPVKEVRGVLLAAQQAELDDLFTR